jgi:sulfur-oxidizing protein SoxX
MRRAGSASSATGPGPLPALPPRAVSGRGAGTLAPDLAGAGARWSEGQLRLRIVDAPAPESGDDHAVVLPQRRPRARGIGLARPAGARAPQQVEDVVAFLRTLRD